MGDKGIGNTANDEEKPLPKRDWVLIPLLVMLTNVAIACSAEVLARLLYPESETKTLSCLVLDDPTTGVRAIPNTRCSERRAETELIDYSFNSCGHRAGMECKPKSAGTYRIVMVGSSDNLGMWVSREKTFAALLPEELSRRTGRRIELYNEAMEWRFPRTVDLQFKEVLAAQPDMVLWPMTPNDISAVDFTVPVKTPAEKDGKPAAAAAATHSSFPPEFIRVAFADVERRLFDLVGFKPGSLYGFKPRSILVIRHWLFKSQSQYVKQFLMQGDASEGLRSEPNADWQKRLEDFAGYFADVQAQAHAIGAIVVVTTIPGRAQAAMISMNEWPAGFDPYRVGNDIRSVVLSHGGIYVDILPAFRNIPNPEQSYFPVDGHPDASGHAIISRLLADALTSGAVPVLKADALQPTAGIEPGK
jgi:hypothetical protein